MKALQILGDSYRGLDFALWHLLDHVVFLPVLTYGAALCFLRKGRFKQLQLLHELHGRGAIGSHERWYLPCSSPFCYITGHTFVDKDTKYLFPKRVRHFSYPRGNFL